MKAKDFITPVKTITSSLVYSQKDLYTYMKKWLGERQYDIIEQDYTEKILANGGKLYAFTWLADRRVDDYTKFVLSIEFKAEAENVEVELHDGKKKTAQKGTITIKLASYLEKDIEAEWQLRKETAYRAFFREVYDKLVEKGKWGRYQAQLNKEFQGIMADIKTYLKMHRYD